MASGAGHCHGHVAADEGALGRDLHLATILQQRRPARHVLSLHLRQGTYLARYNNLFDGRDNKIDASGVDVWLNRIELQDRGILAAIRSEKMPRAGVAEVLSAYQTLARAEQFLRANALESLPWAGLN